jgi:type II secretory pathway pseudopilin PulG
VRRRALPQSNSFTLVEMLAVVAVLSLLLVLVFSMVDSTSRVLDRSVRNGDASVEARQILDRMGADIEGMVLRPDVDQFFYNGSGNYNDAFFFYSQVPGYFPASSSSSTQDSESLIGYRVNPVAVNLSG